MSKADSALKAFEIRNCAQSVLAAYAADYGLEINKALQAAVGFGGGMGRVQDVCGALSGAVIALGLASGFKEEDGRDKINAVYAKVHRLIDEFSAKEGTIKCRDLLGCDLLSEEGQKVFREKNLKDKCRGYVKLCCDLLDKYLAER
jgi:C_GCAxxG_C_C family probable redox protein